jgi:hypothetical protein
MPITSIIFEANEKRARPDNLVPVYFSLRL